MRLGSSGVARLEVDDLSITPGITAVLGPSGAGKSSLLNLLVGYEQPTAGAITQHLPDNPTALNLFWVPPGDGLWPAMTVRQHLTAVTTDTPLIDEILDALDLTAIASRGVDDLSRGERARLSLARALASGARVLVMDEPLSHVSDWQETRGWEIIQTILKGANASLIFATHRPQIALQYADRAICLDRGQLIYQGAVQTLYHHPPDERAARCLGPINWFPSDSTDLWLNGSTAQLQQNASTQNSGAGVRPEHLRIESTPSSTGDLTIEALTHAGPVTQALIKHQPTGATKHFVCASHEKSLSVGARIALRLCMMTLVTLLCLTQVSCDSKDQPNLPVTVGDYWSMPSVGPMMPAPRGVAIGADNQIIVLDNAGRVIIFDTSGQILQKWFMPEYDVGKPEGVCLLRDGRYVVADTHYHRLVFFDREGNVVATRGEEGTGPGQFIYPVHVTEDADANLYVAEYGSNDRIQKFNAQGEFLLEFGGFGSAEGEFQRLSGIAWHDGKLYAADAVNHRIQVFTDDGKFVTVLTDAGQPIDLRFPYDISVGSDNNLYIVEYGAGRLTVLALDGAVIGRWGYTTRGPDGLVTPWGLAVDQTNRVWIADTGNRRIVKLERQ